MSKLKINYKNLKRFFLFPSVVWLIIFCLIPILLILLFSFFQRGNYGNVEYQFTLENFKLIFNPLYYKAIQRTISIALVNTVLCLLAGYPFAYYISMQNNKIKNVLLILTIVPFLTSFLIRTYAWMILLGNEGLINHVFLKMNIIQKPLNLLFTPFAVQLGLLYNYLPFMILPLYSSIEKIDKNLYMAANDLGARNFRTFYHITLPLSLSGLLTGIFLVFIPSLGEFVIPDLLGGAKSSMIGNVIKDQYLTARNWPLGSTLVFVIMSLILLILILRNKILKFN